MQCTNPLNLPKAGTAPCGKCLACRISRAKEWSIRLMHESHDHEKSIFLTLTYHDDQLPNNLQISKRELQLFIKRLREHHPEKIKYYACGEYGDTTNRPHYHLIVFGLGLEDHKTRRSGSGSGSHILGGPALKAWEKGYVYGGTVTADSCRYVAEYIQKKLYGPLGNDRQQPFSLMSKGIGLQWLLRNKEQLTRELALTFKGKQYQIPKYYIQKLELQEDLKMSNQYYHDMNEAHYASKYKILDITPARRAHRIQYNQNLAAQKQLKDKPL